MKFEVGKTYTTRFATDADSVLRGTVVKRTAKFVTLDMGHFGMKRVGVRVWDGDESCSPLGRYSMAPVFRASRFED